MTTTEPDDDFDAKGALDALRAQGKALIDVADALEGCTREQAIRVLRASACLLGVDLAAVGLREIER
jgi:hypothetical protein